MLLEKLKPIPSISYQFIPEDEIVIKVRKPRKRKRKRRRKKRIRKTVKKPWVYKFGAQPLIPDREEHTRKPIPIYGWCWGGEGNDHTWKGVMHTLGTREYCKVCGKERIVSGAMYKHNYKKLKDKKGVPFTKKKVNG